MSRKWEEFGEKVCKTVQDAIETQNYDKLNQVISETINQAVDAVAAGVKNATGSSQTKYRGYKTYSTDPEKAKKSAAKAQKTAGMQYTNAKETKRQIAKIETKAPSKAGTIVVTALGYIFGGYQFLCLATSLAATLIADAAFGAGPRVLTGVLSILSSVLMILGLGVGVTGTKKLFRIERFKTYMAALGQKEYCNISELSAKAGKPIKAVIKDLEYMIGKRWFLQGHLDKQKTCLMVTDKMYEEYCRLEQQKVLELQEAKQKELEKKRQEEEQIASGKVLSPEVQKIMEQGSEYIRKIRACNDAIPGEEISAKIDHIEVLVQKIFERVKQEPKCVSDIRKLMEYYLPTTVKLLEAYAQMDAQPVGGENIQTAKREIEATLDTLNTAFEKLLDSLFQEAAWDVSSDISVLNTMLAQEGLKEDGLKK